MFDPHTYDVMGTRIHTAQYVSMMYCIRSVYLQSEGNVDNSVYNYKPDSQLKITERGKQQAQVKFLFLYVYSLCSYMYMHIVHELAL